MLYLVSYDELSDGVRKIKISKDEFMKIYLELLRDGRSEYNGETIVFTDSLVKKNLDLENIKELTSAINKSIMREKITEDQIIDKLVKMIDEIDKFINFVTLKKEESETLIKYSDKIDPGATKLFQELEENLLNYRDKLDSMLKSYVERNAPNTSSLIGHKVTARLISLSGGIKEIAMSSSSAIQILGAEKAFFRFKKGKGTPPKHGVIYEIPDIYKAPRKLAGKIARVYANGIVKAARADLAGIKSDIPKRTKEKIEKIKREFR
jgi:Protein implicated in ribosomal biogenesis, Nop56p homolog